MSHLHRGTHTAPKLNSNLIAIICTAELSFTLVKAFMRSPHSVTEETASPLHQMQKT